MKCLDSDLLRGNGEHSPSLLLEGHDLETLDCEGER